MSMKRICCYNFALSSNSINRKQRLGWRKLPKRWNNRVYLHCLFEELQNTCRKLQNWQSNHIYASLLNLLELEACINVLPGEHCMYTRLSWLNSFFCTYSNTSGFTEGDKITDIMQLIIEGSEEIKKLSEKIAQACTQPILRQVRSYIHIIIACKWLPMYNKTESFCIACLCRICKLS